MDEPRPAVMVLGRRAWANGSCLPPPYGNTGTGETNYLFLQRHLPPTRVSGTFSHTAQIRCLNSLSRGIATCCSFKCVIDLLTRYSLHFAAHVWCTLRITGGLPKHLSFHASCNLSSSTSRHLTWLMVASAAYCDNEGVQSRLIMTAGGSASLGNVSVRSCCRILRQHQINH